MIAFYALLGLALGLTYFALLKAGLRFVDRPLVLGMTSVVRLAVVAAVFWAVAQAGAMPLMATLGGFVAGRWLMVWSAR